jgi:hypothetical protein
MVLRHHGRSDLTYFGGEWNKTDEGKVMNRKAMIEIASIKLPNPIVQTSAVR